MAEGGLFIIWQSRRKGPDPKSRRQAAAARHKKIDDDTDEAGGTLIKEPEQQLEEAQNPKDNNLRQRQTKRITA